MKQLKNIPTQLLHNRRKDNDTKEKKRPQSQEQRRLPPTPPPHAPLQKKTSPLEPDFALALI